MSKWEWKKLKDICEKGSSNIKQSDLKDLTGDYPIFGASGYIQNVDFYQRNRDYIGIIKDGSGVGRTMLLPAFSSVIGTLQYILPKEGNDIKFINYALQNIDFSKSVQGAAIPHIYFKDYGETEILVPPLSEQKRIVKFLDEEISKIETLKTNAETNLNNSRELFNVELEKSFLGKNGWKTVRLGDCGKLKNGMNFTASDSGYTIHSLGVGDFKNLYQINDTKVLSKISLNAPPPEDYLLKDGDIVFVRSNGNKELVGRCVLVYPRKTPTTYSGFCIRFRKEFEQLDSDFLLHFMKSDNSRKILNGKEGANISNLNQKILGDFQIPLPPLSVQKEIVTRLDKLSENVKRLEANYKQIIANCDELKKSILKKTFEGDSRSSRE